MTPGASEGSRRRWRSSSSTARVVGAARQRAISEPPTQVSAREAAASSATGTPRSRSTQASSAPEDAGWRSTIAIPSGAYPARAAGRSRSRSPPPRRARRRDCISTRPSSGSIGSALGLEQVAVEVAKRRRCPCSRRRTGARPSVERRAPRAAPRSARRVTESARRSAKVTATVTSPAAESASTSSSWARVRSSNPYRNTGLASQPSASERRAAMAPRASVPWSPRPPASRSSA